LREDQRQRWQAGERVLAEAYLQRHPTLDAESVIDLIFQEFLLRERLGERPEVSEYLRRFPEHAAVIRAQVELHRALGAAPVTTSGAEGPGATVPSVFQPAARRAADQPVPEEELRDLLRRRWRNLSLIGSAFLLSQVLAHLSGGALGPGLSRFAVGVYGVTALALSGLVVAAWRRPRLTLRQLRGLELVSFATVTAGLAVLTGEFFDERMLTKYAGVGPEAVVVLAFYLSARWFALLVIYGLFIPNTWRRCAVVVCAMAATPVVLCTFLAAAEGTVEASARFAFVFQLSWWMVFGAVLATYGCHKMQALRQEALAARRLGQYRLKQRLGAGGMGEVYLAEHVLLRRPCAVKLIRPDRAGDPAALRRFEREVQATAALTHPNTVQVYDYGHAEDGTFYYAMEYLPGLNLEQLVERDGPLPPRRAVGLLRQVCGALAEAHAAGLVHRDIKPGNVIVGDHDRAKLLDFGLVRSVSGGPGDTRLTRDGDIAGTPAFMSPEQAAGRDDLGPASDVYSLGALAYFLLTARPPFAGRSAVQVLAAHLYEEPAPLTDHADVPAELQAVVLRCLAKGPAERFADVPSLETALAACPCPAL
jgi:hypothetical protein